MVTDKRVRSELTELGFRSGMGQYICLNTWKNGINKKLEHCRWESVPANVTWLKSNFDKGKVYCHTCYPKYLKTKANVFNPQNLELIKYIPTFLTLGCSGKKKKTVMHVDGKPIIKAEHCGHRMGTYQLNDAKKMLRSKDLKCPKCGSRRFHQIERNESQERKLVEVIKSGKFRHLRAYYDEFDGWVQQTVKESFKFKTSETSGK